MDRLELRSGLLTERLNRLLQEILEAVEEAVGQYREEALRTRQENDTLRTQLRHVLLLEADSKWLRSTSSTLGFSASKQQQSSDPELPQRLSDGPVKPSCQLLADSAKQLHTSAKVKLEQFLVVQNKTPPSRTVFPARLDEQLEQVLKFNPRQESPPPGQLSPSTPSASDALTFREEPEIPVVVKAEPEQNTGTEPEQNTGTELERQEDTATWTSPIEGNEAGFRSADAAVQPLVLVCLDSQEAHRGSLVDNVDAGVTTQRKSDAKLGLRCPRCGEVFGDAGELRLHMEQKRKAYACNWCCKSFAQSADLRRHLRTHTGERPHRCSFCSKSFSQHGNLRRHLRIHTGERPYSCPFCCRGFSDGDTMKKHKRTHSGEQPYGCVHCCKSFSSASSLHAHLRKGTCSVANG